MSDQPNPPVKPPKLTVSPDVAMGQYANFVSIAHNYAEVLMDFGRTLPGRADIPVVSRIIMNPFQAKQLLRALSHNLQMYEKTFGPIHEPHGQTGTPQPGGAAN
jgi:hypothetical protein